MLKALAIVLTLLASAGVAIAETLASTLFFDKPPSWLLPGFRLAAMLGWGVGPPERGVMAGMAANIAVVFIICFAVGLAIVRWASLFVRQR